MQVSELKIKKEYQELIRGFTPEESKDLKSDIERNRKIYVPIVINGENEILDGHHRYEYAKELHIDNVPTTVHISEDKDHERLFVIGLNKNRRHLDQIDRAFLATEELKTLEKIAEREQKEAGKLGAEHGQKGAEFGQLGAEFGKLGGRGHKKETPPLTQKKVNTSKPRKPRKKTDSATNKKNKENTSRNKAAKSHGLSAETQRKYDYVTCDKEKYEERSEFPIEHEELKQKLINKQITITEAYNTLKREEKRQQLETNSARLDTPIEGFMPILGSFSSEENREILEKIHDNSVDLILTDPPYAKKDVEIYAKLAREAVRVLKPGCSLLVYGAHHALQEILRIMNIDGLNYWWIIAVKHNGASARMHGQHVFIGWKPMLWFVKGTKLEVPKYTSDFLIESTEPSKISHDWEQSLTEATYLIERLTVNNQVVWDPMLGGGTTAVAALKLGRQCIGTEIDSDTLKRAKQNIRDFTKH